jgi:hypothetical protein
MLDRVYKAAGEGLRQADQWRAGKCHFVPNAAPLHQPLFVFSS